MNYRFVWKVVGIVLLGVSFHTLTFGQEPKVSIDSLRRLYEQPQAMWPKPEVDSAANWSPLGRLPVRLIDAIRPPDSLKQIVALGETLFFDPVLSGSNQISCANCHNPELAWTDNLMTSVGHDHKRGNRNSPSLINSWQWKSLFWDGRVSSLEEQALKPIENPIEMNQPIPELLEELNGIKAYKARFEQAFGDREITADKLAKALATFERTIVSRDSKFDKFIDGKYKSLNDEELLGLHLFRTRAKCMNCHSGPYFTNGELENVGLTYYHSEKYKDLGRYDITHDPKDVGRFRVPTLREVMRTGPWMHNGLFTNMDGIMNMYNAGMPRPRRSEEQKDDPLFPETSHLVHPLDLTKPERDAIVQFLHSITSTPYRKLDRPVLPRDI